MLQNWDSDASILEIAEKVRRKMNSAAFELSDDSVHSLCIDETLNDSKMLTKDFKKCLKVIRQVYCTLRCELDILQDIAEDKDISEIMVNGPNDIFVEKKGRVMRADIAFETREQLERVIQRIAASVGREINDLNPIVDARLSDGSRVNAVHSNIAINGPILTIRRFTESRMGMDDLIEQGSISKEAADFVQKIVASAYNIFVSGGTSSGKTTFLNILSDCIPKDERLIVIEDSAELQIRAHSNLVRMETKMANAQGKGAVSIRDLIKSSLRMRPDRVIVGEVRGVEAVDMIAAMSTGHDGSLSTGHANSAKGMIKRLESMFLAESAFPLPAVQGQIAEGIEFIIHLERDAKGIRRVVEISEFTGYEKGEPIMNEIYIYEPETGLKRTKNKLRRTGKLRRVFPEYAGKC